MELIRIPYIRVFISSPGDVYKERQIMSAVIHELRSNNNFYGKVIIEPILWENLVLGAWIQPQRAIELELPTPAECDIVIVIFWGRMGTPLPLDKYQKPDGTQFLSGTEWEYYDAVREARENKTGLPKIYLYRCMRSLQLDTDDERVQFQRVESFFDSFRALDDSWSGSFYKYDTLEQFEGLMRTHLEKTISNLIEQPILEADLDHDDFERRVEERGYTPEAILAFIRDQVKPVELRRRALDIAVKRSFLDSNTIARIVDDPYTQIREKFVEYVRDHGIAIAEEQITSLMEDSDLGVSRRAVEAARGLIEAGTFTTSIYRCLKNVKHFQQRYAALKIIREIDDSDAIGTVFEFAKGSTYWKIRREVSEYIEGCYLTGRLTHLQIDEAIEMLTLYATDGESKSGTLKVVRKVLDILQGGSTLEVSG